MNQGKRIALVLIILVMFIVVLYPVVAQTKTFSLVNGKQIACTFRGGFLNSAACRIDPNAGFVERGLSFLLNYVGWGGLNFLLTLAIITFIVNAGLSRSHAFENDGIRALVSLLFGFSAGVAVLTSGLDILRFIGFFAIILIPIAVALGLRFVIIYLHQTLSPGSSGVKTPTSILNVLLWISITLFAIWLSPVLLKIP